MSRFFIRRPIVAMVLSIFLVLFGLLVLRGIPVAEYPDITPPMIKITAAYSGANALDVEASVATPIEQQVNGVENMLYMQSVNAGDGSTTIQVSFEPGTDLDKANMLTQNRVAMANASLPAAVLNTGVNTKKALSFPLAMVSLYSPGGTYTAGFINNYNYINVVDRISRIKGVGDVNVFGGAQYAMRVWLQPDHMAALRVTVADVRNALAAENNIAPGGAFGYSPAVPGTMNTYSAQLQSRLTSPTEFGNILIRADSQGGQVRLKQVARIELGAENYAVTSRFNGREASTLSIYQVPGSNALDVAEAVQKEMTEIKKQFPNDLDYRFSLNTTLAVHAGIEDIFQTLLEAMALVIAVVFLFLQDWRATLIPLITIPVSLIGTFVFFPLLGFSVNVLSLLGMVLAIGLVVDDAIVVVEAVMHHIEQGLSPKDATLKAMSEVAGPVMTIAVVLSAVFIPVALTGGITGRLYQQFAITIAVSVLLSAFNALTLTPALAALILRPKKENKGGLQRFFTAFNRGFDRLTGRYTGLAGFFTRKLVISLGLLGLIVIGAGVFTSRVPAGFVPEEDEGYFLISVMLPDAASFQRADEASHKVEDLLKGVEGIESVTSINGYNLLSGVAAPNSATLFVQLIDWKKRTAGLNAVIAKVNGLAGAQVAEATVFAIHPPPIPGLGNSAGFTLELQDQAGKSPLYLAAEARNFIAAAKRRPEIGSIYTLYRPAVPQVSIRVNRDKLEKLGLSLADVNGSISALLGGAFINNFNLFGRQYRTYLQADANYRMTPESLNQFFVRNAAGQMIPLGTLVTVADTTGPLYTNRFNLYRSAEISGSPAAGYSSSQAMAALEQVAKETLPQGIGYQWSNMSYQEKVASGKGSIVFALALLFVFLILAAQYESWKLPFSVLMGTPWAVMGAMLGLYLSRFFSPDYVNNVFAQIGLVMLIGLNAKNAILIVEFAKIRMEEGATAIDAALESAKLRFRPIIMTSMAFILGVVPLVMAEGAGAEARKVMGVAVFSGMITATLLGCTLIPSFFVLIARQRKSKRTARPVINPAALTVIALVLFLSGCVTQNHFTRPATPATITYHDSAVTDTGSLLKWFELYKDPALLSLIHTALDSNRNLLTAIARIQEAREQVAIAKAGLLPAFNYQAQAGGGHAGNAARSASGGSQGAVYNAYAGLSWEIDLWGKLHAAKRSALATYLATVDNQRALQVSLVADVAGNYFQLRNLDHQLLIAQHTFTERRLSREMIGGEFDKGYVPQLDLLMAIQQQADAGAQVPALQRQIVATENALRLLLGQGPGTVLRGYANEEQPDLPAIPEGLPSQLLQRRPDILSAEQSLIAQFEQVGIARANRFPSLTLTGTLGFASPQLHNFLSSSGMVANGFGSITGPIFHFNQLRHAQEAARKLADQAALEYQQTVLTAFGEVDLSLISVRTYAEEYQQRKIQADACEQALRLSEARYKAGFTSYLEVLVQQDNLFTAQLAASAALQGKLNASVLLYKSLGGGW